MEASFGRVSVKLIYFLMAHKLKTALKSFTFNCQYSFFESVSFKFRLCSFKGQVKYGMMRHRVCTPI